MRHTMGQDWGGRRKINPDGCPVITSKMVLAKAEELGIDVLRGEPSKAPGGGFIHSSKGVWWIARESSEPGLVPLVTLGSTNYLALRQLEKIKCKQMEVE